MNNPFAPQMTCDVILPYDIVILRWSSQVREKMWHLRHKRQRNLSLWLIPVAGHLLITKQKIVAMPPLSRHTYRSTSCNGKWTSLDSWEKEIRYSLLTTLASSSLSIAFNSRIFSLWNIVRHFSRHILRISISGRDTPFDLDILRFTSSELALASKYL